MARPEQTEPLTLADVESSIAKEQRRLEAAENTLALNADDTEANETRRDALTKLNALAGERDSLKRIAAKRKESEAARAARARAAADRKTAQSIPECIANDQRRVFKEKIMRGLELLAEGVSEFESLQDQNQRAILSLRDGKRGRIESLLSAARNVSLTLQIRDVVKTLHNTRLLSPWVVFEVPKLPNRQPSKDESHYAAQAYADALMARTIDDVFDDCAASVRAELNRLLGPPAEPVDPADIVPWHGRSEADRPDSFVKLMESGKLDGLREATERQREHRAQRVKDSAAPADPSGADLT